MDIAEKQNVDLEETPQSRHRKKLAKEHNERKKSGAAEKTWYEKENGKIMKKTITKNGNLHSTFVCRDIPKHKALVDSLKVKPQSKAL